MKSIGKLPRSLQKRSSSAPCTNVQAAKAAVGAADNAALRPAVGKSSEASKVASGKPKKVKTAAALPAESVRPAAHDGGDEEAAGRGELSERRRKKRTREAAEGSQRAGPEVGAEALQAGRAVPCRKRRKAKAASADDAPSFEPATATPHLQRTGSSTGQEPVGVPTVLVARTDSGAAEGQPQLQRRAAAKAGAAACDGHLPGLVTPALPTATGAASQRSRHTAEASGSNKKSKVQRKKAAGRAAEPDADVAGARVCGTAAGVAEECGQVKKQKKRRGRDLAEGGGAAEGAALATATSGAANPPGSILADEGKLAKKARRAQPQAEADDGALLAAAASAPGAADRDAGGEAAEGVKQRKKGKKKRACLEGGGGAPGVTASVASVAGRTCDEALVLDAPELQAEQVEHWQASEHAAGPKAVSKMAAQPKVAGVPVAPTRPAEACSSPASGPEHQMPLPVPSTSRPPKDARLRAFDTGEVQRRLSTGPAPAAGRAAPPPPQARPEAPVLQGPSWHEWGFPEQRALGGTPRAVLAETPHEFGPGTSDSQAGLQELYEAIPPQQPAAPRGTAANPGSPTRAHPATTGTGGGALPAAPLPLAVRARPKAARRAKAAGARSLKRTPKVVTKPPRGGPLSSALKDNWRPWVL